MRARLLLVPVLIALSVASTGCGGTAEAAEASNIAAWRFKVVVPREGVAILADSQATAAMAPCSRTAPEPTSGTWRVKAKDVRGLDGLLAGEVARQLEHFPLSSALSDTSLAAQARTYYVQVVGVERDGRRLLYVNGFASDVVRALDDSTAWHYQPVVACAGGQEYFGVEYDPRARTLAQFAFNRPG
jgi:hypothetical protein